MLVLVAGGTGMLGAPVVRRLLAGGARVRVLTRRAGHDTGLGNINAEIVSGDVTAPSTLGAALRGCDALHVSLRGANDPASYEAVENRGLAALLHCARDQGVRHVSYLSGAGRVQGSETLLPVATKLAAEALVKNSGMPYTIFRATHFMESLDLFIRKKSATILGAQPHRYHYLAAEDFATMVLHSIERPPVAGRVLYAFGPEPFSMREALEKYMAVLHPGGRIQTVPLPIARWIARLTGNRDVRFATLLFEGFVAIGEDGDPREANELLGTPQTRLDAWLAGRVGA